MEIQAARFPDDCERVREIFREYASGLGIDLCFQDFASELADLPGKYAAPRGRVLLAMRADELLGCVAMRPLDESACEMKRLYIRPAARGMKAGKQLVLRLCDIARAERYRCMRLDTLPEMHAAQALYRSLGFEPIQAYVFNPVPGAAFLQLDLG
jgi:ribosomal protein S18 acetylase RimI-like enzyme